MGIIKALTGAIGGGLADSWLEVIESAPMGDNTVFTRGIDFVWKNNTDMPAYIFAKVENVEGSSSRNTITVYVYGKPLPEGVTYKSRNEIIEEASRQAEAIYTNDASIPTGYQLERVQGHKYYVAEAYQDKYVDGKLAVSADFSFALVKGRKDKE